MELATRLSTFSDTGADRIIVRIWIRLSELCSDPACNSTSNSAQPQELSSEGQAWLRAAISGGNLSDLRWPDFSDYSSHAQKFYEFNGDSLWWAKGMEPTVQAQQVVALLLKADQTGSLSL